MSHFVCFHIVSFQGDSNRSAPLKQERPYTQEYFLISLLQIRNA